jgi:carbon-monoxide dehydrogenase medium subunit
MGALQGYFRPRTVAEATALLAQDADAKPIAGGATLVAMVNARVLQPAAFVSLAGIAEIQGLSLEPDGRVRIGAFTRHRDTAASELLRGANAVVREAAGQIANATVRNMGTLGGSIAFADPGLDYPPALVAAEAEVEIASATGRRTLPAREFFVDWYTTALAPGEIVTAVRLPAAGQRGRAVYLKHARVAGDYATVSIALAERAPAALRAVVGACGPTPISSDEADATLRAGRGAAAVAQAAAALVARADPLDDVRASADHRRRLVPGLLARALQQLAQRPAA